MYDVAYTEYKGLRTLFQCIAERGFFIMDNLTKIIFLDIDGVLNNHASIAEGIQILPEKCKLIRTVCEKTEAKIVISSTWRRSCLVQQLDHLLWVCGGPYGAVIAATPCIDNVIRGREIQEWTKSARERTKQKVAEKYVIIDDDSDFLEYQLPFHIKTDMRTGLLSRDLDKIFEILGK